MKIGILVDELAPGGLQKVAIKECRQLIRRGHQVTLLVLTRRGGNQLRELTKKLKIVYLEDRLSAWQRFSFRFPVFAYFSLFHLSYPLFIPEKIGKGEFDILLAHGSFVCPTALRIKRKRGIPVVSFVWDTSAFILPKAYSRTPLRLLFPIILPLARRLDAFIARRSDVVLSPKPSPRAKRVVPSAFNGPKRLPDKDYRQGYFLSVTKWNRGKNPFFLLEVAKRVPRAGLVIAGAWEDRELLTEFLSAIRRDGLADRVRVVSKVTENSLRNLYRKARGFIYPNWEAFGMGALEASAYANPIIMPRGSGVWQFLDEACGFAPREGDLSAYVRAWKKLLGDPSLAGRMGKAGFASARRLTWEEHSKQIEAVLEEALAKKMLVFNLGFVSSEAISGGDVLFMDLARHLPRALRRVGDQLAITVLIPRKGEAHWRRLGDLGQISFQVLPSNPFDRFENPLAVFLSYLVRSFQALRFLPGYHYYYSCSDTWADTFPPFAGRLLYSRTRWLSRIYHIYLSPWQRQGSFFLNAVSSGLQRLSWLMMRLRSQTIVALNQKLAEDLKKYHFGDLPVLGAGVDLARIENVLPSREKYQAIFVGRLSRTKGVYDLLSVWELVVAQAPQARLAIVGGGPARLRAELRRICRKKGIAKNVDFLGFVSEEEKYGLLKSAQVFVFPSHEEGWGIVVSEAMACRLPVVAYNLDIFGAVYQKGFALAPLFDIEKLAGQVVDLLTNRQKRDKLARKALAEAQRFDNQRLADDFVRLLGGRESIDGD